MVGVRVAVAVGLDVLVWMIVAVTVGVLSGLSKPPHAHWKERMAIHRNDIVFFNAVPP